MQFSPGLLFQSVPGPGQQPQTFESAGAVVARPSWNLLAPKSTQPLPASTTSLVVDSTTAALSPNDMILLEPADTSGTGASSPHPVLVASATVDYAAKVTNVTLQAPAVAPAAAAGRRRRPSPPPQSATAAVDGLIAGGLGKPTTPVPGVGQPAAADGAVGVQRGLGRRAAAHLDAAARRRPDAVRGARPRRRSAHRR